MAELFGAIQRGLGSGLSGIYDLTGSYALAIVLLTIAVRALMLPLTIKQTRSMKKMSELAPQTKELQKKYKEKQAKATDRTELQQIRMEMNREMQEMYRAAGVNPLGGCLPLIAQMPVFIAMFSIMRAAVPLNVGDATLPGEGSVAEAFAGMDIKSTICRPYDPVADEEIPPFSTSTPSSISCDVPGNPDPIIVEISDLRDKDGVEFEAAPWISQCTPRESGDTIQFSCRSALGTGHIPEDSKLFRALSVDGANIVSLSPGCSANEVGSKLGIRTCTSTQDEGGTAGAIPYYLLIALIVATSYYQTKQMQSRQTNQPADQQKMMMRIMPVFFGFISLSIPAGANTYFLASNLWTIGQQHLMFRNQTPVGGTPAKVEKKGIEAKPLKQKPSQQGKPSGKRASEQKRAANKQRKRRKR